MSSGTGDGPAGVLAGVHRVPLRSADQEDLIANRISVSQYVERAQRHADAEIARKMRASLEGRRLDKATERLRTLAFGLAALMTAAYLITGLVVAFGYADERVGIASILTGSVGLGWLVWARRSYWRR